MRALPGSATNVGKVFLHVPPDRYEIVQLGTVKAM
jgi:hypothetical protein